MWSNVIGLRHGCRSTQKRRMLNRFAAIATVPMTIPRPGPIPGASPKNGVTKGRTT